MPPNSSTLESSQSKLVWDTARPGICPGVRGNDVGRRAKRNPDKPGRQFAVYFDQALTAETLMEHASARAANSWASLLCHSRAWGVMARAAAVRSSAARRW